MDQINTNLPNNTITTTVSNGNPIKSRHSSSVTDIQMKTEVEAQPGALNEEEITIKKQNLKGEFNKFLVSNTVYETIPENMKILVFNIELSIKDAVEAMIKEDIYCGLIWDTELNKFIGIFTIRDFLNLIKVVYDKINNYVKTNGGLSSTSNMMASLFPSNKIDLEKLDAIMEDPESSKYNSETKSDKSEVDMVVDEEFLNTIENNLLNYKEFFKIFRQININDYFTDIHPDHCINFNLISVSLDGNLKECLDLMKMNKIHRVIVEDTKSSTFTGFITYETIFEYFVTNYYSDMLDFHISLSNLQIKSKCIQAVDKNETIFNSLLKFWDCKISILPIMSGSAIFGFLFLRDIVYFFSNGEKFSFSDPISKFIEDLYDGVDVDLPYGKDRIIILENSEYDLKEILEMMIISPERKLLIKSENGGELITISDIFNIINMD